MSPFLLVFVPSKKCGFQRICIYIQWLGSSFKCAIPSIIRIIGLENDLPPPVINLPVHLRNSKSFYPDDTVLTKPSGRKCIGNIQQGIDQGFHRMADWYRNIRID